MIILFVGLLALSSVCTMIRCLRGPDWTDRIMTFDLLNNILVAAAALYAIYENNPDVVTLVLVLAPLSFVSNAIMAFYLERRKES
nr:hypothetical protein CKG001_20030 [Bdellovibrio sp. CKG001]